MNWRILWGHQLENKVNDLEGETFEAACIEGRAKLPEKYRKLKNPGLDLIYDLSLAHTPYTVFCRIDGRSWNCRADGNDGEALYYDSIMRADEEPVPEP